MKWLLTLLLLAIGVVKNFLNIFLYDVDPGGRLAISIQAFDGFFHRHNYLIEIECAICSFYVGYRGTNDISCYSF